MTRPGEPGMKLKIFAYFVTAAIVLIFSPLIILIFLNAFIPHPMRTIMILRDKETRRPLGRGLHLK